MKRKQWIMVFAVMTSLLVSVTATAEAKEEKAGAQIVKQEENANMIKVESKLDFDTSVSRIESFLKEKNITVFYTADHKKNAEEVGLPLGKTKVLIFGDPKVGTLLMQDNPEISYDLPLRLSIIQEGKKVYLVYKNPEDLAQNYKLKEESKKILEKMTGLYKVIVSQVQG